MSCLHAQAFQKTFFVMKLARFPTLEEISVYLFTKYNSKLERTSNFGKKYATQILILFTSWFIYFLKSYYVHIDLEFNLYF